MGYTQTYQSACDRTVYMQPEAALVEEGAQQMVVYTTPAGVRVEHVTVAQDTVGGREGFWIVQTYGAGEGHITFAEPTKRGKLKDGSTQVRLFSATDAGSHFELGYTFGTGRMRLFGSYA